MDQRKDCGGEAPEVYYMVQRGDSLWRIARRKLGEGVKYMQIKRLNGLVSDVVKPGMALKLPATGRYW